MDRHRDDDDGRRVRPLPPTDGYPARAGRGPANAFLAVLLVLGAAGLAFLTFWPEGGPPSDGVPDLPAATVPATLNDTTTAPPRLTTTTLAAAIPILPEPISVETSLGQMAWQIEELSSATKVLTNPVATRSGFAYVSGSGQLLVHRSPDGTRWTPAPTGIDAETVDELTALAATDDGLLLTGYGFGRPRLWVSADEGPWPEVDLPRPERIDVGPFAVFWSSARPVPVPGRGFVVWGGAWVSIDWNAILGDFDQFSFFNSADGQVMVASDGGDPRTYSVTFEPAPNAIHVRAVDVATGEVMHDSVGTTGGFDPAVLAGTLQQLDINWRWQPALWAFLDDQPGEFVEPGFGSFSSPMTSVVAASGGLVAVATAQDAPVTGVRPVVRSDDGVNWEPVPTEQFGENINMTALASDGDALLLIGSAWKTVQISEDVSAFRSVPSAWSSTSGRSWVAAAREFSGGRFDVTVAAGGRVGFAVVERNCATGCRYDAWLSPDRASWSRVELDFGPEMATVTGVALSDDTVVVLGAAQDDFGRFSDVRAWVGVVG